MIQVLKTAYYEVGGHVFSVSGGEEFLALMENYAPFHCDTDVTDGERAFSLTIGGSEVPLYSEELRQEEEGQEIVCGKTADGKAVFEFRWWNEIAGWLVCSPDYREG